MLRTFHGCVEAIPYGTYRADSVGGVTGDPAAATIA
jgi:hypothetical protein